MRRQQLVTDVVEVADQRHADAARPQPVADMGDCGGTFVAVDGDAHKLGAGASELRYLPYRRVDVGGVGVRHGLHDDRRTTADADTSDVDAHRSPAWCGT